MRIIEDAVILAGGMGTRMLPASLYTAKETLPLVDTPIINHLIWEACEAGVKRIHIVHSPDKKKQFEKLFDRKKAFNLNDKNISPHIFNLLSQDITLRLHEQKYPGGVGDAISSVIDEIEGAFLLMLGDNLLMNEHLSPEKTGPKSGSKSSKKLVDFYKKNAYPCAGLRYVANNQLNKFGVVGLDGVKITKIVEKPKLENSPSNYILCGRYILLEDTKELLKLYSKEKYGELQSIAILNHYIENNILCGIKLDEFDLYDSGDPISWIKAQIDHSLKREDMKEEIYQWLQKLMSK